MWGESRRHPRRDVNGVDLTAVALVCALGLWHLRNRRHPGWRVSDSGRSYFLCGYSVAGSSLYWLAHPPVDEWQWLFALGWGLAGIVAFMRGFDALSRATGDPAQSANHRETVPRLEQLTSGAD
ncbi:hypothetical protein AWC12_02710 [Mycolicibacterium iranicum]|uniref:Uncharacterized protein n=1 Tax=Mycolicibacterium iranicum TaxID=912594 RepID=A0A1X1X0W6_MYCIR|nr:hypothetical protein AWC12_02710 [Mycolicibacterium iranicum]